jgi:hypothetical protein
VANERAWLIAHTDQMRAAFAERLKAGYDPVRERRDLREAIWDRCRELGMSPKEAQRFVKERV